MVKKFIVDYQVCKWSLFEWNMRLVLSNKEGIYSLHNQLYEIKISY